MIPAGGADRTYLKEDLGPLQGRDDGARDGARDASRQKVLVEEGDAIVAVGRTDDLGAVLGVFHPRRLCLGGKGRPVGTAASCYRRILIKGRLTPTHPPTHKHTHTHNNHLAERSQRQNFIECNTVESTCSSSVPCLGPRRHETETTGAAIPRGPFLDFSTNSLSFLASSACFFLYSMSLYD